MLDRIEFFEVCQVVVVVVSYKVEIVVVFGIYNMIYFDFVICEVGYVWLVIMVVCCVEMFIWLIMFCIGMCDFYDQWKEYFDNDMLEVWCDFLDFMVRVVVIVEEYDVDFGIELELVNMVNFVDKVFCFILEMQSLWFKIVFDLVNFFEVVMFEEQCRMVFYVIDFLVDWIVMVYVKDCIVDGWFVIVGLGVFDYWYYLNYLKNVGFLGSLVIYGLVVVEVKDVVVFFGEYLKVIGV